VDVFAILIQQEINMTTK